MMHTSRNTPNRSHFSISLLGAIALLGACAQAAPGESSVVRLDLVSATGSQLVATYVGQPERADAFRAAIVERLQGNGSGPVWFSVTLDDRDAVEGTVGILPDEGRLALDEVLAPIANEYGFQLQVGEPGDDGIGSTQQELYKICEADYCRYLKCDYGIISAGQCLPLCAHALHMGYSLQQCGIQSPPCLIQICFGACFCVYN